jgi:hypothetical protein
MVSSCSRHEYQISEDTLTATAVFIDSIFRCTRASLKEIEHTFDVKYIVVDLGHAYSDLHQQSYPLGGSLLGAYSATMIQKKQRRNIAAWLSTTIHRPTWQDQLPGNGPHLSTSMLKARGTVLILEASNFCRWANRPRMKDCKGFV